MVIVVVCMALQLLGLAAIVRWGGLDVTAPLATGRSVSSALRTYVWHASLTMWTAIVTALVVVGPGARLAMRLLAATAGPAAQGRKTEADEIVGRITADGTISIFLFVGLFAGIVSALTFVVVRRWLPRGRLGGLALGVVLLATFGSRIDPLRAENPDFDIVGPAWLAIVVFAAMSLVQGMAVVAIAGRLSRSLPIPSARVRTVVPHLILLLLIPTVAGAMGAVAIGVVALLLSRAPMVGVWLRSSAVLIGGRVVLAVATLVAGAGLVSAVADIAGRGP